MALELQPSKLNNIFLGDGLRFADYVQRMQQIIRVARLDLTTVNSDLIINANSPFEWLPALANPNPKQQKSKQGILLIHGLFDSPFTLRDLGSHFSQRGFLVRSILLPGHGTRPGDLLNIHYQEWIKAVRYGIASLMKEAENVYVLGYSLGGLLAILSAIENPNLKGLILIAPALRSQSYMAPYLHWYRALTWFYPAAKWYRIRPQKSFIKYESYACNAGVQAYKLIQLSKIKLLNNTLKMPMFVVASDDDETVAFDAVMNFFKQQPNKKNQLLLYSNQVQQPHDGHISIHPSYYPEEKILNFSHTCLPITPTNAQLGRNSNYKDFLHYPNSQPPHLNDVFLGAVNKTNLQQHVMQRLSYNPDFAGMLAKIDDFLATVTTDKTKAAVLVDSIK